MARVASPVWYRLTFCGGWRLIFWMDWNKIKSRTPLNSQWYEFKLCLLLFRCSTHFNAVYCVQYMSIKSTWSYVHCWCRNSMLLNWFMKCVASTFFNLLLIQGCHNGNEYTPLKYNGLVVHVCWCKLNSPTVCVWLKPAPLGLYVRAGLFSVQLLAWAQHPSKAQMLAHWPFPASHLSLAASLLGWPAGVENQPLMGLWGLKGGGGWGWGNDEIPGRSSMHWLTGLDTEEAHSSGLAYFLHQWLSASWLAGRAGSHTPCVFHASM